MRTSTASEECARYAILHNDIILVRLTLVFGVSFWINRNKRLRRPGEEIRVSTTALADRMEEENIVFVDFIDAPPM